MNWFLFLLGNISRERIYWEGEGNIPNLMNKRLHDCVTV